MGHSIWLIHPNSTSKILKLKEDMNEQNCRIFEKEKITINGDFSIIIDVHLVKCIIINVSPGFGIFFHDFFDFVFGQKSITIHIHFLESIRHFHLHILKEFGHVLADFIFTTFDGSGHCHLLRGWTLISIISKKAAEDGTKSHSRKDTCSSSTQQ